MDLFRKTYEIYGMVEKSCVFKIGSGFIRADFKQGSLATSGVLPATFTTSDRVIQCVIETSEKYKTGIIKPGSAIKIGEVKESTSSLNTDLDEGEKEMLENLEGEKEGTLEGDTEKADYPDVTTGQAARAILSIEPYNVSMVRLQRNDEIRLVASEVGITFSNWK